MSKFKEYAELYRDAGFNPLPCNSEKAPLTIEREGKRVVPWFHESIDDIDLRFESAEKIGLVCGKVSSGLYVIDFDAHKGEPIHEIWEEFTATSTYRFLLEKGMAAPYKSPHGYHVWFICPEIELSSQKLAMWAPADTMIETRGNGSMCITYPSAGYKPLTEHLIESIGEMPAEMANALLSVCRSYNNVEIQEDDRRQSTSAWPEHWDTSTPHGKYNEEFGHEALELLKSVGWDIGTANSRGITPLWRPGKTRRESIGATWGKRRNMFYCFTSSVAEFEPNKAYSPFNIFTNILHGGDWKQAQNALRERFGMPRFEITQDETEDAIEFPIDALPDDLQYVILQYQKTLNFKPDFTACAMLSAAATIVGNSYKMWFKNEWKVAPIFWFAIVSNPGTTKSHPINKMLEPLREIDKTNKLLYDAAMKDWESLEEKEQKKAKRPRFKQSIISDATLEAVHMVHDYNKKGLLVYRDELYGFFMDMNKYRGGGDRQFWLESFNNSNLAINRVTKDPILLENICINIIGSIQPDLVNKALLASEEDGLTDRFLYTAVESEFHLVPKDELDMRVKELWQSICQRLASISKYEKDGDEIFLKRSEAAWTAFHSFDVEILNIKKEDGQHPKVIGYASKMLTNVNRFALLLCLLDHVCYGSELEVQMDHYLRASKLCFYFIHTFKRMVVGHDSKSEISMLVRSHSKMSKIEQCAMLLEKGFSPKEIMAAGFDKTQISRGRKKLETK